MRQPNPIRNHWSIQNHLMPSIARFPNVGFGVGFDDDFTESPLLLDRPGTLAVVHSCWNWPLLSGGDIASIMP